MASSSRPAAKPLTPTPSEDRLSAMGPSQPRIISVSSLARSRWASLLALSASAVAAGVYEVACGLRGYSSLRDSPMVREE